MEGRNVPKIIIFADGGKEGGGSGARKLLERIRSGELSVEVSKIISGYENGGVKELTDEYSISFEYVNFPKRVDEIIDGKPTGKKIFDPETLGVIRDFYQKIIRENEWDFIFLSGWMRYVLELPANKTVNIHPGPTQGEFGGEGKFGDAVHKKVFGMYERGEIGRSCVTMHYVTEKIDDGPIICQIPVNLDGIQSWEDVKQRANKGTEHKYQWIITRLITEGKISWSGVKGESVIWDTSITPEYMLETFGVEWKTEGQGPLADFEAFKK